ncbi:MAG: hypothetical protein F4X99_07045 [Gammaproteobacteria bacterium]|nr:hypothetical protein [Gammaproteobacteria bacterium]
MNISEFRSVAAIHDARVVLDSRTDELKVRPQTFLNRAVDWIREKISPNPLAGTERDVAHNRFLRAIADYSGYDGGDVSRAEALLSVDVLERRPLTSRRVREVIEDLDRRSTPAMRENRTTVAWMSTRGVDARLREHAEGAALGEGEREQIGDRIDRAIHAAGGDGLRKVEVSEATRITHGVVDGFLSEKAARAEAEAQARAAELARQQATETRAAEAVATVPQAARNAPAAPTPEAAAPRQAELPAIGAVTSHGAEPASQKELVRLVNAAKLPGKLPSELRKLVKSGSITSRAGLAKAANQRTADWAMEKRVGRWYGDALKRQGARGRIRNNEELMAPTRMLDEIARSIKGATGLLTWSDAKQQARAVIDAHVSNEVKRGAS